MNSVAISAFLSKFAPHSGLLRHALMRFILARRLLQESTAADYVNLFCGSVRQGAKCGAEFGQWGADERATMLSFSSNFGFLQHASS